MVRILQEICKRKEKELEITKSKCSLESLKKLLANKKNRNFKKLLEKSKKNKTNNIIAEIKKSSPSAGNIVEKYYPEEIAEEYEKYGAGAISILTESNFFEGNIDHIPLINSKINLPILRKDFIIDAYQIFESKVYKADAILLITSILSNTQIKEFIKIAKDIGLDCIIETHSFEDLQRAIEIGYPIIGINNRNLDTLAVNTNNTLDLIMNIKKDFIIIGESGLKNNSDIKIYNQSGIYNFLIGESLLKSSNKKKKFNELLS